MTRNVDQLRSIQTFEELIPFLEDDLDWPFPHGSQDYEFDHLTFEYTPDELGLEDEYAAKIKRIHQLRPLVSGQPWGIFFVEFENKKLPIVVLRRILSHLVLKKRKSANPADRARWNAGDLLFISAFAEEGTLQREIAFAHFHQDPGDQPTLRVLGWDGGDTPLKLEHVSQILKHRLSWPRNPTDHVAWRKQWAGAFRHSIGQQIRTADLLAQELARVARNIRDAAMALMKVESSRGPLRRMHEAFRIALIHDLTQEGFADTYAQTITYGLLTAAISRTDRSGGADGTFVLSEDVHNMVPITNPFLKEMLESFLKVGGRSSSHQPGLDFDELGVQEVVELLRSSEIDLPAVLEDFGNKNPGEDPVIRFYEDFLKAYDKELKIQRGVFYTPQPVVSYIVRSVHEILQSEFGLPDGLASEITWGEMAAQMEAEGRSLTLPKGTSRDRHFVVILDPATGTATFLVEVIDLIFRTLMKKWKAAGMTAIQQQAQWNYYVPVHLLPRLFGYELLMAPYAIAHMKVGLKLHETGYLFMSDERVRIYLTNALEPASDEEKQMRIAATMPALAHEAAAVNLVKSTQSFTVVVGNPPYSTLSLNMGDWIKDLVKPFRAIGGEQIEEKGKRNHLQDDYVKFIRLALLQLESSSTGVVGLITNHGYLFSPTFRAMRNYILEERLNTQILDLNGNAKRDDAKRFPGDENVFDIQQGVAISLFWNSRSSSEPKTLHAELFGSRSAKMTQLSEVRERTVFEKITPLPEYFLFESNSVVRPVEYSDWCPLNEAMPFGGTGIKTNRDAFVIDFEDATIIARMNTFRDPNISDQQAQKMLDLGENYTWKIPKQRRLFRADKNTDCLRSIDYRPFDTRRIYYNKYVVYNPRFSTMAQASPENVYILLCRQQYETGFRHAFVTRNMFECCSVSAKSREITSGFPLYILDSGPVAAGNLFGKPGRHINFSTSFRAQLHAKLGLKSVVGTSSPNGLAEVPAMAVLGYIYALLHSPEYRNRYAENLKLDFPRIPICGNRTLFDDLSLLGARLIDLHLLEAGDLGTTDTKLNRALTGESIGKIARGVNGVIINSPNGQMFEGVSDEVWKFQIGSFQVCEKWLKDRKGRQLSAEDLEHYAKIVKAISETIKVMGQIDLTVQKHGGWPGAFA